MVKGGWEQVGEGWERLEEVWRGVERLGEFWRGLKLWAGLKKLEKVGRGWVMLGVVGLCGKSFETVAKVWVSLSEVWFVLVSLGSK